MILLKIVILSCSFIGFMSLPSCWISPILIMVKMNSDSLCLIASLKLLVNFQDSFLLKPKMVQVNWHQNLKYWLPNNFNFDCQQDHHQVSLQHLPHLQPLQISFISYKNMIFQLAWVHLDWEWEKTKIT